MNWLARGTLAASRLASAFTIAKKLMFFEGLGSRYSAKMPEEVKHCGEPQNHHSYKSAGCDYLPLHNLEPIDRLDPLKGLR